MLRILPFFWTYASAAALCFSGFVSARNLIFLIAGMLGMWGESFWDDVWTDTHTHVIFGLPAISGGIFALIAYVTVRRNVLTRNHILIILAGVTLFVFLTTEGAEWTQLE